MDIKQVPFSDVFSLFKNFLTDQGPHKGEKLILIDSIPKTQLLGSLIKVLIENLSLRQIVSELMLL